MKMVNYIQILSLGLMLFPGLLPAQYQVRDIFDRDISTQGITLTDWEGYIANPAIGFFVAPNSGAQSITLTANHPRLYFDMPSTTGASGPSKTISVLAGSPQMVYLSIFPDRDGANEAYTLTLSSPAGTQNVPILVKDEDQPARPLDFNILLDFSQDNPTYNFFGNSTRVNTVTQAATDWAYFMADQGFDAVGAGQEQTFIWSDNFSGGYFTSNTQSYTGFLIYPHGYDNVNNISGGAPSTTAFQTIGNVATPLRRSGSYTTEKDGNFNTLGWLNALTDNQWYLASNLSGVQNDLYSISLHEMGHALVFNPGHTQFESYKTMGEIDESNLTAYFGSPLPIDASDHFDDGSLIVDPLSKRGAFGSEYANQIPLGRWLITKLNLLALQAVGYNLRTVSCFIPLATTQETLASGTPNVPYSSGFAAEGGLKSYHWAIVTGALPAGLTLNSFTGQISGTPTQSGAFPLEIELRDYENTLITFSTTLDISGSFPVEWLEAPQARLQDDSQILVQWTTASEQQLSHFEVQRSSDLVHFSSVGQVPSRGYSASPQTYQFSDADPLSMTSYYRIRAIDRDGAQTLSHIAAVTAANQSYRIGPNPAQRCLSVSAPQDDRFQVALFNESGQLVFSAAAHHGADIDVGGFPEGLYYLRLTGTTEDIPVFPVWIQH